MHVRSTCAIATLAACMSIPVAAQVSLQAARAFKGVGLEQRLGERVPFELPLLSYDGHAVDLGTYFDGERPVVMTFVYHTCPMLCPSLTDGVVASLRKLNVLPGREFEMLSVSIHPNDTPETARNQRERTLKQLGKPDAEWHFLTGGDSSIATLTNAVGFRYRWVEDQGEYAHPAAVVFIAADGTITRYLADLTPPARDVKVALVEASRGSVGNALDRAFLYCFRFDPERNSYVMSATVAMRIGGLLTVLLLAAGLCTLWGRELRRKRRP